jgi:hypothetical protein
MADKGKARVNRWLRVGLLLYLVAVGTATVRHCQRGTSTQWHDLSRPER